MQFRQLFIIEGKVLGDTLRSLTRVHEQLTEPLSLLFYCKFCGEVYAKCPVMRADGSTTQWQSFRCCCRKCAARSSLLSDWPGCVWLSWDRDYLAALPEPVLQWELLRHIDSYERTGGYR